MRGARRATRWVAVAFALVLVVSSCSGDDAEDGGGDRAQPAAPSGSKASSPFAVSGIPDRFSLLAAGTGDLEQGWGEDCCGTDEPFTVLERTDGPGGVVRVAKTGYEGNEGGFYQATNGYVQEEVPARPAAVEGKQAVWWPGDPRQGDAESAWAELAVDEGNDLAVTVAGEGADRDELEAVYRSIELDASHATAPRIASPPEGFAVMGSVDATGALALHATMLSPDHAPGPRAAHSAGWRNGNQEIVVLTVPGRSMSLEAAAAALPLPMTSQVRTVRGRRVAVAEDAGHGWRRYQVVVDAPWGDVVLVGGRVDGVPESGATTMPTTDDLVDIALSVERASEAEWKAFTATAADPDDVHADPGRTEITRGVIDGVGWLLQTEGAGPSHFLGDDAGYDGTEVPARCLILSTGEPACASTTMVYGDGVVRDVGDPELQVIISTRPAVMYEAIGPGLLKHTGPMVPVPGGKLWAGVAPGISGAYRCVPGQPAIEAEPPRLNLYDESGKLVGCIGRPD